MIVSIDPGLKCCGLAIWDEDDQRLYKAYLVKNPTHDWTGMIEALDKEIYPNASYYPVIIEVPQVYARIKSKGDPNDLIDLAVLIGAIVSRQPHKLYRPAEWKGQTPKEVTEARARKRLSAEELTRVVLPKAASLAHNVWDAVGLGLFHLGRK